MSTITHLRNAYIELLMIDDVMTRVSLNNTYCLLRDTIADATGVSSQEVQEDHEEIAIKKKHSL